MKKIENFGDWVIEHWLVLACTFPLLAFIAMIVFAPRGVTLSEKEFKCIEASPDGLSTRCDLYARRIK